MGWLVEFEGLTLSFSKNTSVFLSINKALEINEFETK